MREAEITEKIESLCDQFAKWPQRIDATRMVAETSRHDADKARDLRDLERRALAEKHPETAEVFDPADESNDRYDARRRELEEHELERFRIAAEDARSE